MQGAGGDETQPGAKAAAAKTLDPKMMSGTMEQPGPKSKKVRRLERKQQGGEESQFLADKREVETSKDHAKGEGRPGKGGTTRLQRQRKAAQRKAVAKASAPGALPEGRGHRPGQSGKEREQNGGKSEAPQTKPADQKPRERAQKKGQAAPGEALPLHPDISSGGFSHSTCTKCKLPGSMFLAPYLPDPIPAHLLLSRVNQKLGSAPCSLKSCANLQGPERRRAAKARRETLLTRLWNATSPKPLDRAPKRARGRRPSSVGLNDDCRSCFSLKQSGLVDKGLFGGA